MTNQSRLRSCLSPQKGRGGSASPSVAARYYIHVTETHVAAGFGKFVEYQTHNVAEGLKAAFRKPQKPSNEAFFDLWYTQRYTV